MAIVAKAGATFSPCPAGSHIAVCIDVVDLGMVKSEYKGSKPKTQHKIRVVWQTGELRDDGKPFLVSKRYTLSLHEKAALRKDLESWRGRAFTSEELEGFDVEAVLGAGAMVSVIQTANNGTVYANVNAVMKPPKGVSLPELDQSYVRVCNRKPEDEAPPAEEWTPSDDDVPF